jgi:hypothetical protein
MKNIKSITIALMVNALIFVNTANASFPTGIKNFKQTREINSEPQSEDTIRNSHQELDTINQLENPQSKSDPSTSNSSGESNGMAVAGFVLSLVGLIILAIPMGILAIIFSSIGLNAALNKGKRGKGLAIAGLIIGIIDLLVGLIVLATVL